MGIPFWRSVQVMIMLRREIGDMRIYGKRRYIESRIGNYVGTLRGELYCNGIFFPCFEVDRIGRSENRSVKQNFQRLCHPENRPLNSMTIIVSMKY